MNPMKTKDVTRFLTDMVELAIRFEVDDEGYVVEKSTGEHVLVGEGEQRSPIILYQEEIKDQSALILNPLAEGLGLPPSAQWFYITQRAALIGRLSTLCTHIMTAAVEAKKKKAPEAKEDEGVHLPMELLKIAALIGDDVDEKMLVEFDKVVATKFEFLNIYYQKKNLRSVLHCGLFAPEDGVSASLRAKLPEIRKKAWGVFDRLILAVFGAHDADELASKYNRKATETSCVRLSSFLNVLLAVYQDLNPLLDLVSPDISVDLSKLVFHINHLPEYAGLARYMAQVDRRATPAPTAPMIPGAAPQVPQHAYTPPAPVAWVPGPMTADGRQSAPVPVMPQMAPGAMPYGGVPMVPGPQHSVVPQPQMAPVYGYQQPPPQNIPFSGPYTQTNYLGNQPNMSGVNLIPGMPSMPRW